MAEAKTERNQEILRRLEAGEETYKEIAEDYGISRERVRQLGRKMGYKGRKERKNKNQ